MSGHWEAFLPLTQIQLCVSGSFVFQAVDWINYVYLAYYKVVSLGTIKAAAATVKSIGSDRDLHTIINYMSLSKDLVLL